MQLTAAMREALADIGVRDWAKRLIIDALDRDPVDVIQDLELVTDLWKEALHDLQEAQVTK